MADSQQREAMVPPTPQGWCAVVYGRTYRIDEWWRAMPAEVPVQGPVGRAVLATVAGGKRLADSPRYLLARGAHGVLVGAACRIDVVDQTRAVESHGRPLYGFVGWHHRDRHIAGLPGLRELEQRLSDWAGPTYQEWVTPAWEARTSRSATMLTSTAGPAPWDETGPGAKPFTADHTALPSELWARQRTMHVFPQAEAALLWDAVLRTGQDFVLGAGWREARDGDPSVLTHLCSADATGHQEILHKPPPPTSPPRPGRPPGWQPSPAAQRDHRSGRRDQYGSERRRSKERYEPPREDSGGLGGLAKSVLESLFGLGGGGDEPAQDPGKGRRDASYEASDGREQHTDPYGHREQRSDPYRRPVPPVPQGPAYGRTREVDPEDASAEGSFDEFDEEPPRSTSGPRGSERTETGPPETSPPTEDTP
ncbi:hypothetical protein [Streptomyces sp. NPDC002889]|uniref:hypothetical protein n=1 Tax=Streptomyces sp. NPDC002889 TaxID=3364669 RepID=UPI0036BCDAAF